MTNDQKGILAAVLSPVFLGLAPVLGKVALHEGLAPFSVAALRTALVVILLWGGYLLFWRQYIYIYPAGLLACVAIGFTNGIGSLFYYNGLDLLDASVAQMINAMYLFFVVLLIRMEGTRIGFLTSLRVMVALLGVFFITGGLTGNNTWLGVGFMMGNALLFAGTVVMSQRILYEMPAQTVTLYVMTAMGSIVVIARLLVWHSDGESLTSEGLGAILALGITTALSRLFLFRGVKGVGSIRTALLAIAESAVAVSLSFIFLRESFSIIQWSGVAILIVSLFMPTSEPSPTTDEPYRGRLPNIAGIRFRRMAGAAGETKISTQEMRKLVGMMVGPTDKLSTQETNELKRLLGEEGYQKLQELEARLHKPQDH